MSYPLSTSLLEFWRSRLEGDPPFFVLPGTKPRPAKRTFRAAACRFDLAPRLYDAVCDLARSRATGPDRILLATFALLLYRYSHHEEIRIGAILPGLPGDDAGYGETGGATENVIFVDCKFAGETAFSELLACIDHEIQEAIPLGHSSPETLAPSLGVECDPSYPPFCNVAFQFAGQSAEPHTAPGGDQATVFDLELRLAESKHSVAVELRYYADVFTADTVARMTKHFVQLLQAIVDAPAGKIDALPMILQDERQQVLVEWNRTKLSYEQEKCLHELVEEQADRTPDEPAVVCRRRQLSYRELNARSNQLAHYLVKLGVGPEVLVGLSMERSLETVIGLLGVLKAGGAYVPLDPDYPAERCTYMAQDSGIHVLLTEERWMARYFSITAARICLRSQQQAISAEPSHNLPRRAVPGNLAYVLYTSGSTGLPKGVSLQHGNAVAFVKWASTAFTRDELAGVLACTSLSFDLSIFELFVTLACGGKIILVKNALEATVSPLPGLTLVNTVPSAMNELLRMKALPHSVQTVNLAGEPLSRALASDLYQSGIRRVLNLYGPTEATTYATWCEVKRNIDEAPGIGAPLVNMRIYVLDAHFQPVPIGVSGEIFIGGDGLARGYVNRPELTAEKFVPDPFGAEQGARLYRTGDLGLWRADGNLEFLGRADKQVKVRGFRIELAEIEATLLRQPGVREAAVVVREDAIGQKSIVAYLVPAEGCGLRPAALRSGLQQSLPEYMVPSEFIALQAMPCTPSGKLDRKRLVSAGNARPMMDTAYAAPHSAAEKRMTDIWIEVLQMGGVGVNDHFLELGGHSLLAMRLAAKIQEAFGVEIPFGRLLENPTPASLVEEVLLLGGNSPEHTAPILPSPQAADRPLSYAQQRLWFLHQFHPENFAYNIPIELRLKGALDRKALQSAFTEMTRRHAVLRTVYKTAGDTVQQVVQEPRTKLEYRDLSECEDPQAELDYAIQQEAQRCFDVAQGPVMRELLFRLSAEEHVMLLTIHHIAVDGWSIDVLVRELRALYPAFLEGQPSPLPELLAQYCDYAIWQREWLQDKVLERQMEYWKKQLAALPPPLELPGAAAVLPADKGRIGAEHRFAVPAALFFALQQTSRKLHVTLHMILLAAFQLLLCRYSGQDDIVVASPVAGRNQKPTEDLIGFFVNTLLLRTQFAAELSVEDLLGRVRDTALEAYAHQDLPFERLVEILQPERDLSGTPLVQTMFSLEKDELRQWTMAGISATARERWNGSAKFDLTLIFEESAQELAGIFEYRKHLFSAGTVERMARHLTTLLWQMAERPERKIRELKLLTLDERREVAQWNETRSLFPREQCVHELFREQAESAPGAVALCFAGQRLTYAELNAKANQLAHCLRQLGSAPEEMIGICVEPSLEMAVGLLGILKAGGAYVPLDPEYPKERLAFMLQEAGVRVLVTQQKLLDRMPSLADIQVVCIDPDAWRKNIAQLSEEETRVAVSAENLAYGMFTSGSTGRPKCVAITHRGIDRLVRNTNYIQMNAQDRMAQISNLSFDALTFEVWGALLNGAALVALERDTALDPKRLAQAIREHGISVMLVTTALFNQIAHEMPEAFSSLRVLLFGGEAADANAVRRVLAAGAPPSLVNAYGPTENTSLTSWYAANAFPEDATAVPIGAPIANTTMYVLDPYGQLVPAGVTGELYTGGDGLARGYLGRPDLTAERFVPDPFAAVPGERLYRTGDLVRRLPDGATEFVARNDQQIKLRGFRIELAEIEAALREWAAVREALVMLREDSPGDKRLVAYVVGEKEIQGSALRSRLAERLPDYMLPSDFVVLEKFPLTPNGKIDRKALPARERLRAREVSAAPLTMIEQLLANIWAEVLHAERIGIHDDFFELGGHSLLAMQVTSRIREAFGIDLPVRQLFEHRTIENLARNVDAALKQTGPEQMPPLVPGERQGEMPLSFAQQRLWFLYQFESDLSLYNVPIVLRLTGELREEALTWAVNEIPRRHEPLRTGFGMRRGTPFQTIHAHQPIEIPGIDLSGHATAEREAEVARRVRIQVQTSFDLSRAPLLRGELLRLGPEENVLILVMHHIAVDGWSLSVFAKELAVFYETFTISKKPLLPELPVQYIDYVIWQRQWLQSGVEERQFAYWKKHLAQLPGALELPAARPRPAKPNHSGAEYDFAVPGQVQQALHALCRKEGATLFMTTLATFLVLLHQYTQQTDIVVGTPTAGRALRETEELIGFFVNTLVLRIDLSGTPTFAALLKRVREVTLAAYANQDIPFERLVDELQPERDMSRSPLFQIMFVLQNAPASEWVLPGLRLKQQKVGLGREKFDLTLFLTEVGNGLHATISYNTELFDEKTIRTLAEHYKALLAVAVEFPSRRIDEMQAALPQSTVESLERLTEDERWQVIEEQKQTVVPYEREQCVQELFEAQVKRTPKAIAVAFAGEQLTYWQLNRRANQVAHHLRRFGVGPEIPVGLFMERSLEMVIGILGIVKAGGVYVPLDPEYPADRLTHMLQDSGVRVLLTQNKLRDKLKFSGRVICLDGHRPAISAESQSNPAHLTVPENLIYLMYTSGSTGRPKGTAVPHRGVVRLVRNTNYVRFGRDEVFLQFAPVSFDASTLEIWGSLLNGARLEIMPPEMPSLQALGEAIVHRGVTILWLTAGLFHQMVDHQLEALKSVSQLLAGGDVLSVPHVRRLLEGSAETQLINGYGPTENTTFTCCYPIPGAMTFDTVPIGVPVANTQVYVLDKDMHLVPGGVAGELYTGGDGLARGYLNQPELTAEKFVPNPFSDVPGQRLYRTGDLAKRERDGVLGFIGRKDDQVKIRGFRIEPQEIETVLSEQPGIESAAVVVQSDASRTKRLVAYVVARPGSQVEWPELGRALKQRLPEYMVPAAFVALGSLPLTPNGKVDRKALAQRREETLRVQEFTAPRTPVEELLATIWCEVLQTERIGVHDNFFESGGHSLLAMQIVSRVREFFPVNLPVRTLFECPTVAELTGRLLAGELKPGITLKIAEAFLGAKESGSQETQALGRNIA